MVHVIISRRIIFFYKHVHPKCRNLCEPTLASSHSHLHIFLVVVPDQLFEPLHFDKKIRLKTVPVFFRFHVLAVKIIGNQMKMHALQRRSVVVPHVDRDSLRDRGQKMFFNVLFQFLCRFVQHSNFGQLIQRDVFRPQTILKKKRKKCVRFGTVKVPAMMKYPQHRLPKTPAVGSATDAPSIWGNRRTEQ